MDGWPDIRTVFVLPGKFRVHHCAKVGSTSIADAVRSTPHVTGGRRVDEPGPEYRWAVVRHPLDRLVSMWAFFCGGGRLKNQPALREIGYREGMPWAEFLPLAIDRHDDNPHTRAQCWSLGPHKFDRLGRLFNLEAEWKALKRRFPIIPLDIGWKNRSAHDAWAEYYTREQRSRAEAAYAADMAHWEASDPSPPKE